MEGMSKSAPRFGGDYLRTTLQQIPTIFGRLVYLASLRDQTSGTYEHEGLAGLFGPEDADRRLRHSHRQVFSEWLECNLEEQKTDLDEFLSGAEVASGRVIRNLEHLAPYRDLIPSTAREVERQLYLTDVETLMELLKSERAAASWNPEA
jgi:hypothetical protein